MLAIIDVICSLEPVHIIVLAQQTQASVGSGFNYCHSFKDYPLYPQPINFTQLDVLRNTSLKELSYTSNQGASPSNI